MTVDKRRDAQTPAARHGVLGVQQQVEEDLLQFPGVAVDGGKLASQIEIDQNLRGFELVLKQRKRVANDLVQVCGAELGCRSAREVKQAVGNFSGAEALLRNLVEHRTDARVSAKLL